MELKKQFIEIAELIQDARNKALSVLNRELIELYWGISKSISQKVEMIAGEKVLFKALLLF